MSRSTSTRFTLLGLLLCMAVFQTGNCDPAPVLGKHTSISRSRDRSRSILTALWSRPKTHGLKFVHNMDMLVQGNDQASPWFCHGLDCPAFKALKGGEGYEAREYSASNWFSTSLNGEDLSTATEKMFMKLFDYIEGENAKKQKIAMTAPVLIRLIPGQGPTCKSNFTMSFFGSRKLPNPPAPTDKSIFFSDLPEQKVYVGSFSGFANEKKWLECAEALSAALIKDGKKFVTDYFLTAGYDSPFRILDRHNEVWYIAED